MANKNYQLKDPESGQIYDFNLDHRPTVTESLELIGHEKIRRNELKIDQHETNRQVDLQSQKELNPDAMEREKRWLTGLGQSVVNTLNGAKSEFEPKNLIKSTVKKALFGPLGDTASDIIGQVISPHKPEIPVISPVIRSGQESLKGNYEKSGEEFGQGTQQGVMYAAPFIKGLLSPATEAASESTTLTRTPTIRPPSDTITSSEVINQSKQLPVSSSLSSSEGGESARLGNPQISKVLPPKTVEPLTVKPPEVNMQESINPNQPTVEPPTEVKPILKKSQEIQVSPIQNENVNPERLSLLKQLNEARNKVAKKQIQSKIDNLDVDKYIKDMGAYQKDKLAYSLNKANETKPNKLTPEQQEFINKGGKITILPPDAEPESNLIDSQEVKDLAKSYAKKDKQGLSVGKQEDEEPGTILGGGFGSLQNLGKTKPKNIVPGAIERNFGKVDKTLENYPQTKEAGQLLGQTSVSMNRNENEYMDEYHDIMKGSNKADRLMIDGILRNYSQVVSTGKGYPSELIQKATKLHNLMDKVRADVVARFQGSRIPIPATYKIKSVGWRPDYAPDIKSLAGNDFLQTVETILNTQGTLRQIIHDVRDVLGSHESNQPADVIHESRLPGAPHILKHEGVMSSIEHDPDIYFPKYAISMNRVGHLRPMYQYLDNLLRNKPLHPELQNTVKAAMKQLKNPQMDDQFLADSLSRLSSELQSVIVTSKLALSPKLAVLHAGAGLTQALPRLGPYYSGLGIKRFLANPQKTWDTVRRYNSPLGSMPFSMKSVPRQIQDISMLGNVGYLFAQSTFYNGFLQKAIDSGLKGRVAEDEAASEMLDAFGLSGRGRMAPFLAGTKSTWWGRFITMYRTTPYNLIENFARQFQMQMNNPKDFSEWRRSMYYIGAGLLAYELLKKYKLPLWHFSSQMLKFSTALEGLGPVLTKLYKGDFKGAEDSFIKFVEPSAYRGYKRHGIGGTVLDYPYHRGSSGGANMGFIDISPNIDINSPSLQ